MEAIGTEDVILAVLITYQVTAREMFVTDSTELAVQFVPAVENRRLGCGWCREM
jgi:hypothetical protein